MLCIEIRRLPILIVQACKQRAYRMSDSGTGVKRPLDHDEEEKDREKDGGENTATGSTTSTDEENRSKPAPSRSPWWNRFSLMKRSASTQAKDKEYWMRLPLEEKRKCYKCRDKYVTLDGIRTWPEFYNHHGIKMASKPSPPLYPVDVRLNDKISLYQGDITTLEIDAIVNAANSSLMGGGGVDGAIHSAAGYSLRDECSELGGCDTGNTKLTTGHRLPAKNILHTVGPFNDSARLLKSCYTTCFQLIEEHNLRSVAFCCIATGVYGFPNEEAAKIALDTTRSWLEEHHEQVDRIIFVVFLKKDYKLYIEHMQRYFPLSDATPDTARENTPPHNEEEVSENNDGCGLTSKTPPLVKSVTVPVYTVTTKETKAEGKDCEAVDPITDKHKGEESSVNEGCGHLSEKGIVPMETEERVNESSSNKEVGTSKETSENVTESHKD